MSVQTVTITLPWPTPRLSPNRRLHHRVRARETAAVRSNTRWLAKARRDQFGGLTTPFSVRLNYRPARAGRRDAGNLCLDSKACIDGLVDAGLAPDDTGDYVHELMPKLHPAEPGHPGLLWLDISWETA